MVDKNLNSTVEPPIMDTLNKGHNRKNLSIKDAVLRRSLLYYTSSLQREDNLSIKNKMAGPKHVHYSEVPLYRGV